MFVSKTQNEKSGGACVEPRQSTFWFGILKTVPRRSVWRWDSRGLEFVYSGGLWKGATAPKASVCSFGLSLEL